MEVGELRTRIESFLAACGVEYDPRRKKYHCPNPSHTDENASAHLYRDTDLLYCPVCSASWDVFDVAGLLGAGNDFPARKRYVEERLGVPSDPPNARRGAGRSSARDATNGPRMAGRPHRREPVFLERDAARKVYDRAEIERRAEMAGWGAIAGTWPFLAADGRVMAVDVRFERPGADGGKAVITFWYDGNELRTQGAPVLLYGLDQLAARPDEPVLVVEGCKSAEAAARIPGIVAVTWNGGTGKAGMPDWSPLERRKVFIWPDDDQKTDDAGTVKPSLEQPGVKAAVTIRKKLPHARIIIPPSEARAVKPDGADAVEALAVMAPEAVAAYIATAPELLPPENTRPKDARDAAKKAESDGEKKSKKELEAEARARPHDPRPWPFSILGISDDNRLAVIGRGERLDLFAPSGITKTILLNLAPIEFWREEFGFGTRVFWDDATDFLIGYGRGRDFDASQVRGRGAWREKDGRICYHDGKVTIGDRDARRLYVRRPQRDIGIRGPEIDPAVAAEIEQATSRMVWESPIDHVRLMGWAVLAPFAGALPWRPGLLITGDTKSGKSTVINYIVREMAVPVFGQGGEQATEAGIRQTVGIDACGVVIDEAEGESDKAKRNRKAIFALMRQSTTDDSGVSMKGTMDGKGITFQLRCMFLFAAINPDIENVADDNRIYRINLRKPSEHDQKQWPSTKSDLTRLITDKNCNQLRARTWNRLEQILKVSDRFADVIQSVTGRDARESFAEAELHAAYWIVLRGRDGTTAPELTDEEFRTQISSLYDTAPQEPSRDENEEMLDRILDTTVTIDEPRRAATLREVLLGVRDEQSRLFSASGGQFDDPEPLNAGQIATLRAVAGRYGVTIVKGELAIAKNHDAIMKMLERGRGYHRQILRHGALVDRNRPAWMGGKVRSSVFLRGDVLGEQPTSSTLKAVVPNDY